MLEIFSHWCIFASEAIWSKWFNELGSVRKSISLRQEWRSRSSKTLQKSAVGKSEADHSDKGLVMNENQAHERT